MVRTIQCQGRSIEDAKSTLYANGNYIRPRFEKIEYSKTITEPKNGYLGLYEFRIMW